MKLGERYILEKKILTILKAILPIQEMLQVDHLDKKIQMKHLKYLLQYFAYGFGAVEPMIFKTQSEFLEKINKAGDFLLIHYQKKLKVLMKSKYSIR